MKLRTVAQWSLTWAMALLAGNASAAGEAISINFGSAAGNVATFTPAASLGLYGVNSAAWIDSAEFGNAGGVPTQLSSIVLKDQNGVTYPDAHVYLCSNGNVWNNGLTATLINRLLYSYLDDDLSAGTAATAKKAGIRITNMPFSHYKVYVYFNRDSADGTTTTPFPAYSINGIFYAGNGTATTAVAANQSWGTVRKSVITDGVNVLVTPVISGSTLQILEPRHDGGAAVAGTRGCIAGIQIVNMGDITWQGTTAGNGTWNTTAGNLAWLSGSTPAAFTAGSNVTFPSLASTIHAQIDVPGTISANGGNLGSETTAYVFQGAGRSIFAAPLYKSGASTATFNNPVGLSSTLSVQGGSLIFNNGLYTGTSTGSPAYAQPIALASGASLAFGMPSGQTQTISSVIRGPGNLTFTGPGSFALTGNNNVFTGPLTVNGNTTVSGVPNWDSLPLGPIFIDGGSTLSFTMPSTTNQGTARVLTGEGTLQVLISEVNVNPAINASGFLGTIRLTQATGAASAAKWQNSNLSINPNAILLVDKGAQIFLNSSTTLANAKIHISGHGNAEYLGAIRTSAQTIGGSMTLLGDTSIGPSGTTATPSTINSNITVDPSLRDSITLFFGRPIYVASPAISNINANYITLNGSISGTEEAPLNLTVNVQAEVFKGAFAHMGSLAVTNATDVATAAATFSSTNTATFADVVNQTTIRLEGGAGLVATGTLTGSGAWAIASGSNLTFEKTQNAPTARITDLSGSLTLKGKGNRFESVVLKTGATLNLTADAAAPALTLSSITLTSTPIITVSVSNISDSPDLTQPLIAWPADSVTTTANWLLPSELVYAQYGLVQKADGLYLVPFGGGDPGSTIKTLTWPSIGGDWNGANAWVYMTNRTTTATFNNYDAIFLDDAKDPPVTGSVLPAVTITMTQDEIIGAMRSVATQTDFTLAAAADRYIVFNNGMTKYGDVPMTIRAAFDPVTNIIVAAGSLNVETPWFGADKKAQSSAPWSVSKDATITFTGLTNQLFSAAQLLTGAGKISFQNSRATFAGSSMAGYTGIFEVGANAELFVGFGGNLGAGSLENGSYHILTGGALYLDGQHVVGWKIGNVNTLFATVEQGGKIIKSAANTEYATRAFVLRGGSLLNQANANPWDFRSGSKITAASGFTSWIGPEIIGDTNYPGIFRLWNDATSANRVEFNVEENAALRVTTELGGSGSGTYGLLKTGSGVMVMEVAPSYAAPTEINGGVFSLNAPNPHQNGTGTYTVGINGLLRGSGTIAGTGTTTVNGTIAGGKHRFGVESIPVTDNTLSLATNLVLNAGSIVRVDNFSGTDALTPGIINVGGTVTVNGLVIVLVSAPLPTDPANREKSYQLIKWKAPPAIRTFTLNSAEWQDAGYVASVKNDGLYLETFGGNDRVLRWVATDSNWYEPSGAWVDDVTGDSAAFTTPVTTNTSIRLPDVTGSATAIARIDNNRPSVDSALFSNTATDYEIYGSTSSRLIITGDLRKNGTGRVTVYPMVLYPGTIFINSGTLALNNGLSTSDSFSAAYMDPIYIGEAGTLEMSVPSGLQQAFGTLAGGGAIVKKNTGTLTVSGVPGLSSVTVSGGTFKASSTTLTDYPAVTLQNGGVFEWAQSGGTAGIISSFSIAGDGGFVFRSVTGNHQIPALLDITSFTKAGNGLVVLETNTFERVPDLWLGNSAGSGDGLVLGGTLTAGPLRVRNFGTLANAASYVRADWDNTTSGNKVILTDLTQNCELNAVFQNPTTTPLNRPPSLTLATSDTSTRKTFTLKGTSASTGPLTVNDGVDLRLVGGWTGGSVIVNAGATASGTGAAANVTIAAGGTLAGGIERVGTLTLTGATVFANGAIFEVGISARNACSFVSAQACNLPVGSTALVRISNPHGFYLEEKCVLSWSSIPAGNFVLDPESPISADYTVVAKTDGLYLARKPRQMWIMTR